MFSQNVLGHFPCLLIMPFSPATFSFQTRRLATFGRKANLKYEVNFSKSPLDQNAQNALVKSEGLRWKGEVKKLRGEGRVVRGEKEQYLPQLSRPQTEVAVDSNL